MMKFLEHDIADKNFLRFVKRFMIAGIMEENERKESDKGTLQGGQISPISANVHLHYVLDLWYEKIIRRKCRGEVYYVRHQKRSTKYPDYLRIWEFCLTEPHLTKNIRNREPKRFEEPNVRKPQVRFCEGYQASLSHLKYLKGVSRLPARLIEMSMSRVKKYLTALPDVKDIIVTVCVLAAASIIGRMLIKIDGNCYIQLVYVLCVVIVARFTKGYLCGFIASVAGMLAVNYAFTYPYFKLDFSIAGYPISFAVMLTVSVIIGMTTTRLKDQNKIQAEIEREKISGNLLRAISHDIRTPLTSISGAVQGIIENRSKLDEDQLMSLLYDVRDEADRLVKMVENILTITRIREQTGEITKTPEAAEEIIGEAVRKFRKNRSIPVEIEIPAELLIIPMDPFLIEHVILNIMENSIIHGKATLISLSLAEEKGNAVFRISDNGRGIPVEMEDKLFTGYFLHADEKKGDAKMNMGIGLSVCSAIISAHGGSICAGNTAEGGAEFTFTLPLDNNENGQETE